MAGKMLSVEPTIDPTRVGAREQARRLYRGRRAHHPARSHDGRLFLRRERRPDHLHHDRKVLLDRGDDPDQPGQSSDAPRLAGALHLSRQRLFSRRERRRRVLRMAARTSRPYRPRRLDRPWRDRAAGPHGRHRRRGRGRRHRHQGRAGLHHRRRQSGAADQAAVSGRHRRAGWRRWRGGTGITRRCAAPCPISASSMSRTFSQNTRRPAALPVPRQDSRSAAS